jgi:hypothetical protein
MSQLAAVRALLAYDSFVRYSSVLLGLKNLAPEHKQIIKAIEEYFKRYPDKKNITVDELRSFFSVTNPAANKATFSELFDALEHLEIANSDLLRDILNHFIEVHICARISQAATEVLNGSKGTAVDEIEGMISEYREIVGGAADPEDLWYNESLKDILQREKSGSLEWGIPWLNGTIGPLKPGTLGHVFARPDGGKTSFALHQIAHFGYELRKKKEDGLLLFLNNEEHPGVVKRRLIQAMLGWDLAAISSDPDEAEKAFLTKGGSNIRIKGSVLHVRQIEDLIITAKPKVVVIDQGPKVWVPGYRDMSSVERLAKLYNKYRELAKMYNVIFISLGQADGASENKKYLGLSNLDNSKVGIPGELDWALGIGRVVNDPAFENTRWLNVAKNKLTGIVGSKELIFNTRTCRYEEMKR